MIVRFEFRKQRRRNLDSKLHRVMVIVVSIKITNSLEEFPVHDVAEFGEKMNTTRIRWALSVLNLPPVEKSKHFVQKDLRSSAVTQNIQKIAIELRVPHHDDLCESLRGTNSTYATKRFFSSSSSFSIRLECRRTSGADPHTTKISRVSRFRMKRQLLLRGANVFGRIIINNQHGNPHILKYFVLKENRARSIF